MRPPQNRSSRVAHVDDRTKPKKVSISSPGRADGHHLGRGCSYSGPSPARSSASPSPAAARLVRIEQPAPLAQAAFVPVVVHVHVHEGQTGGPGMPGRGPANVVGALPPPPRPRRLARLHHLYHRAAIRFFFCCVHSWSRGAAAGSEAQRRMTLDPGETKWTAASLSVVPERSCCG